MASNHPTPSSSQGTSTKPTVTESVKEVEISCPLTWSADKHRDMCYNIDGGLHCTTSYRGEPDYIKRHDLSQSTFVHVITKKHPNLKLFGKPHVWKPTFRSGGYLFIDERSFGLACRLLRRFNQNLVEVPRWKRFHIKEVPTLSKQESAYWMSQLKVSTEDELNQKLHMIRDSAWQVVQEFSIARWWFLTKRVRMNPFYSSIVPLLRDKASVLDVGCGLGQDLRWMREDGANGTMWAVDFFPKIWELGLELFQDAPGPATFIEADVIHDWSNLCPLHSLHGKVDIFLVNDYLSFLGKEIQEQSLQSLAQVSHIGSKIVGWLWGTWERELQEMPVELDGKIWGNWFRGVIMHPDAFRDITWKQVGKKTNTKWKVDIEMLGVEEFGFQMFDEQEFGFDASEFTLIWPPWPLKALCFLATRTE